jgi:hypothetical protein
MFRKRVRHHDINTFDAKTLAAITDPKDRKLYLTFSDNFTKLLAKCKMIQQK